MPALRRLDSEGAAPTTPDLAGMDLEQALSALQSQGQGNAGVSNAAENGADMAKKAILQELVRRRLPLSPSEIFNGGIAGI